MKAMRQIKNRAIDKGIDQDKVDLRGLGKESFFTMGHPIAVLTVNGNNFPSQTIAEKFSSFSDRKKNIHLSFQPKFADQHKQGSILLYLYAIQMMSAKDLKSDLKISLWVARPLQTLLGQSIFGAKTHSNWEHAVASEFIQHKDREFSMSSGHSLALDHESRIYLHQAGFSNISLVEKTIFIDRDEIVQILRQEIEITNKKLETNTLRQASGRR